MAEERAGLWTREKRVVEEGEVTMGRVMMDLV